MSAAPFQKAGASSQAVHTRSISTSSFRLYHPILLHIGNCAIRNLDIMQVKRSPQVFDVVVIGSGAGGGTAVKVLTDLGVNVALLEAGPMLNPAKDFKEHMLPYQVDHRGAGPHAEQYFGRQQWGYFSAPNGYFDIDGEP